MGKEKTKAKKNKEKTESSTRTTGQFTQILSQEAIQNKVLDSQKKSPAIALVSGASNYFGKSLWYLKKEIVTVGRSHDVVITLDDQSISKNHGQFRVRDSGVEYMDLGSTNGTHIDGKALLPDSYIALKDNDILQIGSIRVKFFEAGHMHYELYNKLQIDPLTGINNRGSLDATGSQMVRWAHSSKAKLALIMFDLDDFKIVNDTYGHKAGDKVLKSVVKITKQFLESEDIFARLGGDEFCILMPYVKENDIYAIANNICVGIADKKFIFDKKTVRITSSFGVSFLKHGYDSWEVFLDRADKAHYASKKAGKNKVS